MISVPVPTFPAPAGPAPSRPRIWPKHAAPNLLRFSADFEPTGPFLVWTGAGPISTRQALASIRFCPRRDSRFIYLGDPLHHLHWLAERWNEGWVCVGPGRRPGPTQSVLSPALEFSPSIRPSRPGWPLPRAKRRAPWLDFTQISAIFWDVGKF